MSNNVNENNSQALHAGVTPPKQSHAAQYNYSQTQDKKKRKKKRLVGWLIFLLIVLLAAAIYGIINWQNKTATAYLQELLSDQPFTFSENNYIDYVTENIGIPSEIEDEKGNQIAISWTSDNQEILAADGTVNRPERQNAAVTLTASVRRGIGKGRVDYVATVIKTDVIGSRDVFVPTDEEIESGTCNNNLTLIYDENHRVESIDGSFGFTKVSSLEDALFVVESYRSLFEVDETVRFAAEDVHSDRFGTVFTLRQVVDDVPVWGKHAVLTVDKNGLLDSINLDIYRNLSIDTSLSLEDTAVDAILDAYFGCNVTTDFIEKGVFIMDDVPYLAYRSVAVSNSGEQNILSKVIVDAATGNILSCNELAQDFGEMVKSTGVNEYGETVEFEVYRRSEKHYLHDSNRNISIIDGKYDADDRKDAEKIHPLYVVTKKSYGSSMMDIDGHWEHTSGVSSYTNLITVYDWYNNNLGWQSFNGKGKKIKCLVDVEFQTDNACYVPFFEFFAAGPANEFLYSPCAQLDVMAHEYTHGVFDKITGGFDKVTVMNTAISEGYADIFGCLIEGNWLLGESLSEYPLRDPTGHSFMLYDNIKYPSKYEGEHWSPDDGHINSVLLSRAAYLMSTHGFTDEQIASIWFLSMSYKYSDSADFLDVRANVEKAARKLNCTDHEMGLIGNIFAELGIGEKPSRELMNFASEGNPFLDDTETTEYVILWSPFGSIFGVPIYVFETDDGEARIVYDETVSSNLSRYLSDVLNKDNEDELQYNITVHYERVSKTRMQILKKFADNSDTFFFEKVIDDPEDNWVNYVFYTHTYQGTAYDFWSQYFQIDFYDFSFLYYESPQ